MVDKCFFATVAALNHRLLAFLLPYAAKGTKNAFRGYASPAVFMSEILKQKNTFADDFFLFPNAFRSFKLSACKAECR